MAERAATRVAFGDVVRLSKERTSDPDADGFDRYVGLEHIDPGDLRIRRWGDVADGTTFTNVFRPGQVLFGKRRAYQRKVALADFEGVCSGDIYVLESKDPSVLLPELLPFICQSEAFFEHAVGTSAGSLSPRTNWNALSGFCFELPPAAGQDQLVHALQAIDSTSAALEAARTAASRTVEALVGETTSRVGSGATVTVSSLLREPPRNGVSPQTNADGRGIRTVSLSAVRGGRFDPNGCEKFADVPNASVERFLVRRGDVFVVRGNGNRELTALAGLATSDYDDLFYPDLLIRLRFDETAILPEFAVAQWNSQKVHAALLTRAKSSNGIWKVNGKDIAAHELTVPPIGVQRRTVAQMETVFSGIRSIGERIERTGSIRAAVLTSRLVAS